ncbi:MAG: hypothetical protein HY791_09115 [Deltaproteobacteria bacterium]|nr:hypothetical protein [Deltaproteobacteria bacterium]
MNVRGAVEASAAKYAALRGFGDVAAIPVSERDAAVHAVSRALQLPAADVRMTLAVVWNETAGRSGQAVTGAGLGAASSIEARKNGGLGPMSLQIRSKAEANRTSATTSQPSANPTHKRGDKIDSALKSDGAARVSDEQPFEFQPMIARRMVAFDADVIQPGIMGGLDKKPRVGSYGVLKLDRLSDDDPRLDVPIYRGMGSQDPAVHALKASGRLIPAGTSSDYEAFKTYSHREPLDAYEWTMDPYVALKSAGGHGYLVRTTPRELRAQGVKEITRKVGDTEGGLFISATFMPHVRTLSHTSGAYDVGSVDFGHAHPKAELYAKMLSRKVPNGGGWDEFLQSGDPATKPLFKVRSDETSKQALFFADRVAELDPSSSLPGQVRAKILDLAKVDDLEARHQSAKKLVNSLKVKVADLDIPKEPAVWDISEV